MTKENTTETPATATDDSSALAKYIKTLDPNRKANKSDEKAAGTKFKAFQAKRQAALKVLKDLESEEAEVAKECVKVFGKKKLTVEGQDFIATSRGERIYYKEMSSKGVEL